MPQFKTIDYGAVLNQAAKINAFRSAAATAPLEGALKVAELKSKQLKNAREEQAAIDERRKRELLGRARAGDAKALDELVTIDLDVTDKLLDVTADEKKMRRDELEQGITDMARLAVIGAEAPDEWHARRREFIEAYPEAADTVPEEWSEDFLRSSVAMAMSVEKLMERRDRLARERLERADRLAREGRPKWTRFDVGGDTPGSRQNAFYNANAADDPSATVVTAPTPAKLPAPKRGDGTTEPAIESKDVNAINRLIAQQYDGVYDPVTGTIRITDRRQAERALAVSARAERLFVDSKGKLTHAEAVERAFKELRSSAGAPPPEGSPADPGGSAGGADPKGIRGYLRSLR